MSIDSSSSFSLPEELLIEILVCLPIETLLRFKSVSKSWLALIDSSEFIHRHMLITTTTDNNKVVGPFILLSKRFDRNIGFSWNFFSISGNHKFQMIENIGKPPRYSKPISGESSMNLYIEGSCNGVICLYDNQLRDVSLWNPATHQFRTLPKSPLTFGKIDQVHGIGYNDFICFGFDLETKDYKVVLMVTDPSPYIHQVQVYSLSTDSWRTLEDVVVPAHPKRNGGYLNGSYYGLGTKNVNHVADTLFVTWENSRRVSSVWELFSFDFTKEIFKFWQLPDGMHDNMSTTFHDLRIILSGGKVIIFHGHMNSYDFFVLNEAGAAKESWTRLEYKIRRRAKFGQEWSPLGISNDGEYVLMVTSNTRELSLLNSSTQVMKKLQWDYDNQNGNQSWLPFVYRRSLVPVCSTRNK